MRVSDRLMRGAAVCAVLAMTACGAEPAGDTSSNSPVPTATVTQASPAEQSPVEEASAAPSTAPSVEPSSTAPAPLLDIEVKGPGPAESYAFGPDVSAADRGRIEDWMAYGVRWQEVMFGRRFTTFTTIASNQLRWVAEKYCETLSSMPNCVQQQTDIFSGSVMGGCGPGGCSVVSWLGVEGPDEPWFRQLTYAHEAHHVLFGQVYPDAWRATMVSSDQVWATGPVWLLEGAATWVGEHAAIDRGLISYASRRAEWEEWARRIDRPLGQLETLADEARAGFSYWYYALALEELVGMAPNGPDSILAYYEGVAKGTAWKTAFERAFGISVADFYAEFERIRP